MLTMMMGGAANLLRRCFANIFYDGTLRTVMSDEHGEELVVNGDFSDGLNDWIISTDANSSVDVTEGRVHLITTDGVDGQFYQFDLVEAGKTYLIEFDAELVSGGYQLNMGSHTAMSNIQTGYHSIEYTAVSSGRVHFKRNGANESYTDNISVKQITARAGDRQMYDKSPRGGREHLAVFSAGATKIDGQGQLIPITFEASNCVRYYKDDVLIEDTTVGQTSLTLDEDAIYRDMYAFATEPSETEKQNLSNYPNDAFAHYNANDTSTSARFTGICHKNMPLNRIGAEQLDYSQAFTATPLVDNSFTIQNYTTSCDIIKQSKGLQTIAFEKSGGILGDYKSKQMNFDGGEYVERVTDVYTATQDEPFVAEAIFGKSTTTALCFGSNYSRARLTRNMTYTQVQLDQTNGGSFAKNTTAQNYSHAILEYDGNGTMTAVIDGVESGTASGLTVLDSSVFQIGGTDATSDGNGAMLNTKIWHGENVAKYDRAKVIAKAQKIITALEGIKWMK